MIKCRRAVTLHPLITHLRDTQSNPPRTMQFVLDNFRGEKTVSRSLQHSLELEEELGDKGMEALLDDERQRYGRVLNPPERLLVEKHKTGDRSFDYIPASARTKSVQNVLAEGGRKNGEEKCTTCCIAAVTVKLASPVGLMITLLSYLDKRSHRLPVRSTRLSYMGAIILPGICVVIPGAAAMAHTFHTEKPRDSGNLSRGLVGFFLGATVATVLPLGIYSVLRHRVFIPKGMSRAKWDDKMNVAMVPLKPDYQLGMYKPLQAMNSYEYMAVAMAWALFFPVALSGFVSLSGEGDKFLLRKSDIIARKCVPDRVRTHLAKVDQEHLAEVYPTHAERQQKRASDA